MKRKASVFRSVGRGWPYSSKILVGDTSGGKAVRRVTISGASASKRAVRDGLRLCNASGLRLQLASGSDLSDMSP
jgi:hypothetical protein